MTSGKAYVDSVFEKVKEQNRHEPEFLQAVEEVFQSLVPVFDKYPKYIEENLSLDEVEKEMIRKALEKHHGKRKSAAQDLNISERTLYRKIKEYGLD